MEHLLLHFIKLLFTLFKRNSDHSNAMNFRSIHYDVQTKLSVLEEQLKLYFKQTSPTEQLKQCEYIQTILEDLKKDFIYTPEKIEVLDQIQFDLKYNQTNMKSMQKLLNKF